MKNHLAMIVSMIRMQARNPGAGEDFVVLARRVEALQLLYQELSETGVSSTFRDEVPLGAYVSRIAAAVGHLDGGQGVRVNVIAEEVMVDANTAGRVGLLVSEILTNAFRHAFVGRDSGLVETRVQLLSEASCGSRSPTTASACPRATAGRPAATSAAASSARCSPGCEAQARGHDLRLRHHRHDRHPRSPPVHRRVRDRRWTHGCSVSPRWSRRATCRVDAFLPGDARVPRRHRRAADGFLTLFGEAADEMKEA